MDQPPNTSDLLKRVGGRKIPKVSINVAYKAVGHDKAAYERLLEHLRKFSRSKGSSQKIFTSLLPVRDPQGASPKGRQPEGV
jgi:hypothetical protein